MGRHTGKLLSLAGAALLLSVALLALSTVSYKPIASSSFLRPSITSGNKQDTKTQSNTFKFSEKQIVDDKNGLRTILFPEEHIHREASTIRMQWNVTLEERAPDGVKRPIYLINGIDESLLIYLNCDSLISKGQFPGPTIEARPGDQLEIEVLNSADNDEGISIHWHGLSMKGTSSH